MVWLMSSRTVLNRVLKMGLMATAAVDPEEMEAMEMVAKEEGVVMAAVIFPP
jgi:hypothetical protein